MTPFTHKHHLLSDIERAEQLFGPLKRLYARIPATTCNRQAHCCTRMPEVSYVEFLHLDRALGRLPQPSPVKGGTALRLGWGNIRHHCHPCIVDSVLVV
jgi:hypothetical protein